MSHPLTIEFGVRALEIATEVKVSTAYDAARMPGVSHPAYEPCTAVWDTGAMSSVITPALAAKLGLHSLGIVKMQHANGESLVNTYMRGHPTFGVINLPQRRRARKGLRRD